ncbi:MAG: methylenetetrahydrofolate reductase [NAD(P)H] [Lachnospiraceae bacterium]|nr:methylenetetrahydrofolate reductase [NAD(P)H] [Lachnospiraceae bacterium]
MKLTDIYKKKSNILSFEIFPPKADGELNNIEPTLEILSQLEPDYISVTFGAGGSSNNNKTIALAKMIKEKYHIEPVVHLTCLCYDKKEISEFAKEIAAEGIENVLALRGDRNPNVPEKNDFRYASELITFLKENTSFCVAGACYPEDHPESESHVSEMLNLKKKVDAGADILLSQLFFDNENYYSFVEDARIAGIEVPITPGIMPVINEKQIRRMVNTCGAKLSDKFERILKNYGERPEALYEAGMIHALSQVVDLLANNVDGIHLYTMNNPNVARRICDGIKPIIGR